MQAERRRLWFVDGKFVEAESAAAAEAFCAGLTTGRTSQRPAIEVTVEPAEFGEEVWGERIGWNDLRVAEWWADNREASE